MRFRDLWRKIGGQKGRADHPNAGEVSLERVFVERFAAHFPGATVNGQDVVLPFGGLRVRCELNDIGEMGRERSAALYFWISGGPFDNQPVFASVSGYGATPLEAVVMGCCNWASAFGPLLRVAVGEQPRAEVTSFEAWIDGQPMRVFIEHLDRAMMTTEGHLAPETAIRQARTRLGVEGWLLRRVIDSGTLPLLRADRPVLLSVFAMDGGHPPRLVEVKVNGGDWPASHECLVSISSASEGTFPLLRELAVAVPLASAPRVTRGGLERTLAGLASTDGRTRRSAVAWRGARAHGFAIRNPLSLQGIEALERDIPRLPDDYRAFLLEVGRAGAGPGYGLLDPEYPGQRLLTTRSDPPGPALALAHGGCGITWLLALDGKHRGEVWVDARCADGSLRCVDATFSAWYRRWLDSMVRDVFPAIDWQSQACATIHLLSQVLEKLERDGVPQEGRSERLRSMLRVGSIKLQACQSAFFDAGDLLDPCAGCVSHAARLGLPEDVFATGRPPLQGR